MESELDEIWSLYQDDGGESLAAAEEALETLKRQATQREAIAALFRALHTFKGNSRILGLVAIEGVAHGAEDVVGLVRDRGVPFDREIGDALIETVDVLRGMMEQAAARRADADSAQGAAILQRLHALFEQRESLLASGASTAGDEGEASSADVVYFDSDAAPLGEDEAYIQIFLEFAGDSLARAQQADDETNIETFRSVGEAAERLGLQAWREAARGFVEASDAAAQTGALAALSRLYREATGVGVLAEAAEGPQPSGAVAAAPPQPAELLSVDVSQAITALAQEARARGYEVVAETAEALAVERDGVACEDGIFDLHAGLKLWIEPDDARLAPAVAALDRWCVERGEITLGRLALALADDPETLDWRQAGAQVRRISCVLTACGASEAVDVSARIGDLIARLVAGEQAPDAFVVKVLMKFVSAVKPFVSARGAADATALARVDAALVELFQPRAVERLIEGLEIPAAFVETLSPEAAGAAREAARDGLQMHVVRVDSERRPELTEPFLAFLTRVRVISTRTVFVESASLFDYLIACSFDAARLARELAAIDAGGEGLTLIESCAPPLTEDRNNEAFEPASFVELLETLGAVVTAQASARRLAERMVDGDPSDDEGEGSASWKNGLERLAELQNQIGDSLERLQQEVMSSQLRPAGPLMRDLTQLIRVQAGALEVRLSGEADLIDGETLGLLAMSAPALTRAALEDALATGTPQYAELSLSQSDSLVCLTLRFVGSAPAGLSSGSAVARLELPRVQGEVARLESGEPGYRLTAPRAVALIDGLVMRVGAVRYFAPIRAVQRVVLAEAADRMIVSAADGEALRVDAQSTAPILRLPRAEATGKTAKGVENLFVVISERGELAALEIDEILGQEPLLVRPLAGYLASIEAASGCAVLADGSIGVALDLARMIGRRPLAA